MKQVSHKRFFRNQKLRKTLEGLTILRYYDYR